jgi:hypothetical protein
MSYTEQAAWKRIQAFLPAAYRIDAGNAPREDYWAWHPLVERY